MKIILLSKSLAVSGACWCGDVAAAKVGTSVNESASARAKEREKNDQHKICHQQTHTHTDENEASEDTPYRYIQRFANCFE